MLGATQPRDQCCLLGLSLATASTVVRKVALDGRLLHRLSEISPAESFVAASASEGEILTEDVLVADGTESSFEYSAMNDLLAAAQSDVAVRTGDLFGIGHKTLICKAVG